MEDGKIPRPKLPDGEKRIPMNTFAMKGRYQDRINTLAGIFGCSNGNDLLEKFVLDGLAKYDKEWMRAEANRIAEEAIKYKNQVLDDIDKEESHQMDIGKNLCTMYINKRQKNPREVQSPDLFIKNELVIATGLTYKQGSDLLEHVRREILSGNTPNDAIRKAIDASINSDNT
jgi:hypothetical protein